MLYNGAVNPLYVIIPAAAAIFAYIVWGIFRPIEGDGHEDELGRFID